MERDCKTSWARRRACRALTAQGLLLIYLLNATTLAPIWTALLAVSDSSHHVTVQQSTQGLRLVLRHDATNVPSHLHGVIAQSLALFAQRTAPSSQSDHVIQFRPVDPPHRTPITAVAAELRHPAASVAGSLLPLTTLTSFAAAIIRRPPLAPSAVLLVVRCTVLVV